MEILTQIIEILIGGVTKVGEGLGAGLSSIAQDIFLVETVVEGGETTQTLSVFAVILITFCGISLALGLFRWVLNFLTSLGERNR